ncbi:hypothetical protein [Pleomorphomonas carboxyditropha]|uniref:hypothetical protein n=1 Tax=Pleomorphomonas carboxyditropha TaxID=2023338 RepID=UPI0010562AD1|nr:hypothetical protein [Pleomorphomonas carboxyditropha]
MIKIFAATALSAVMAITSVVSVQAFPIAPVSQPSQIEKAQWSNRGGRQDYAAPQGSGSLPLLAWPSRLSRLPSGLSPP